MTTNAIKELVYEIRALKENLKGAITEFRLGYADIRHSLAEIKEQIVKLRGRDDIQKR